MLDERRIQDIVERVVERLGAGVARAPSAGGAPIAAAAAGPRIPEGKLGIYATPDQAVAAAEKGHEANERASLELRHKMVAAMRETTRQHLRDLAAFAVAETGLGRFDDKLNKNLLVVEKTPGPEILRPVAYTGDHGLCLVERAAYGVILAVTPCTNPTETILCNAIGMLSAGNAVVFNVHPAAARTSAWHIHLLNEAIAGAGGPRDAITMVMPPTIETANALMKHPGVRLVVVTGGPAVVAAAMASGKKVIAAGPGNPPAVVDETADLEHAARAIIAGASLDNNIVCIAEKEIVAVAAIADRLKEQLGRSGAVILTERQVHELEKVVVEGHGPNKKWVGKDAAKIAQAIGLSVPEETRVLVGEVDEAHPFVQHELLMPVLPLVRVKDHIDAIACARRVEHNFCHTASMHSMNIERLSAMARVINASIFIKNAPTFAGLGLGGEGYTSFTIASPTGEGLTTALNFSRERRCTLADAFRFV